MERPDNILCSSKTENITMMEFTVPLEERGPQEEKYDPLIAQLTTARLFRVELECLGFLGVVYDRFSDPFLLNSNSSADEGHHGNKKAVCRLLVDKCRQLLYVEQRMSKNKNKNSSFEASEEKVRIAARHELSGLNTGDVFYVVILTTSNGVFYYQPLDSRSSESFLFNCGAESIVFIIPLASLLIPQLQATECCTLVNHSQRNAVPDVKSHLLTATTKEKEIKTLMCRRRHRYRTQTKKPMETHRAAMVPVKLGFEPTGAPMNASQRRRTEAPPISQFTSGAEDGDTGRQRSSSPDPRGFVHRSRGRVCRPSESLLAVQRHLGVITPSKTGGRTSVLNQAEATESVPPLFICTKIPLCVSSPSRVVDNALKCTMDRVELQIEVVMSCRVITTCGPRHHGKKNLYYIPIIYVVEICHSESTRERSTLQRISLNRRRGGTSRRKEN
ncbi:hypothetical protein F2P81_014369 [Scophthalmus maximus]|uniref:Uncharacterized protein n=1 Tax=Scophthalmus maximus TaxID=52904 RepID=A0A6A4SJK2_SCOMX|nr:hypothetical protein F2P81_014369 [Scophthalmus maximus]